MKLIWPPFSSSSSSSSSASCLSSTLCRPKSAMSGTEHSSNSLISEPNHHHHQQHTTNMKYELQGDNDLVVVKYRYTALVAFFIGFLTIWSMAVAFVMFKTPIINNSRLDRTLELHNAQEKIGRVMFSVGQEMLFTVDAMVSIQLNLSYSASKIRESLHFTWNLTNEDIQMSIECDNFNPDYLSILMMDTQYKLQMIRANLSLESNDPIDIINSYKEIYNYVEDYFISNKWMAEAEDLGGMRSYMQLLSYPYRTLIKGMDNRFIELAYGTLYHIGYANMKDLSSEVLTQYNYYFYSSYELIVNAFAFSSVHAATYRNLLKDKTEEIYNLNARLNMDSQNGRKYTKFVTDVVAHLLNLKDIFNDVQKDILGIGNGRETIGLEMDEQLSQDKIQLEEVEFRTISFQTVAIFFVVLFFLLAAIISMISSAQKNTKIKYIINSKAAQLPTISSKTMAILGPNYPYAVETLY